MTDLAGQVALVTGSSRGIGRAIALELASRGAHIVINYSRDDDGAKTTVDLIHELPGSCELLKFDVSDAEATKRAIRELSRKHNRLDILIANAGININSLALLMKTEQFQEVLNTNVIGTFNCLKAAAKPMLKGEGGRIVVISSVVGLHGNAGQIAYSASKAALIGMTKSLARELAPRKILVNAVAPGYIESNLTNQLPPETREEIIKTVPLGRPGTPEDIAPFVGFLCSKAGSYMTGQVYVIDGGMSI